MNEQTRLDCTWAMAPWVVIPLKPIVDLQITDGEFRLLSILIIAQSDPSPVTLEQVCKLRGADLEWVTMELLGLEKKGYLCVKRDDPKVFNVQVWNGDHARHKT